MSPFTTILFAFYLLTVELATKAKPFYKHNHNVLQLHSTDYDTTINSMKKGELYFIQYFSHSSRWCKTFKGQYINFAKFIEKHHNNMTNYNIKLFAIDIAARNDASLLAIHKRYNITQYPTVLLFINSSTNYIQFAASGATKYDLYNWFKHALHQKNIAIKLSNFAEEYCLNSISGPDYITDSKGWICEIKDINKKTQCCEVMGDYDYFSICHAHRKCDEYYPCCIDYESCIACCLHKTNNIFSGEILPYPFYTNDRKQLLQIQDTHFSNFSFCRHQCRTSSLSTFEGNVYVDYRKYYCYSKDIAQYEEPLKLLQNVDTDAQFEIIVGNKGESCLQTCADNGDEHVSKICVQDKKLMAQINSCTAIKKYFQNCNGGCMFGYDGFLPAFDVRQSRCYLKATIAKQYGYSCTESNADYKRLCLCLCQGQQKALQ